MHAVVSRREEGMSEGCLVSCTRFLHLCSTQHCMTLYFHILSLDFVAIPLVGREIKKRFSNLSWVAATNALVCLLFFNCRISCTFKDLASVSVILYSGYKWYSLTIVWAGHPIFLVDCRHKRLVFRSRCL